MEPCPFCGFEQSDFRHSHNWQCNQCGRDYADWLNKTKSERPLAEKVTTKTPPVKPLFSAKPIPDQAQPVKDAQNIILFIILGLVLLNFVVEAFAWLYPIAIGCALYHAYVLNKTGYAIGRYDVYERKKNPFVFRIHFWGSFVFAVIALWAWIT